MALCEFHWGSAVLGKQVTTRVILPEKGKPPFATFYLLHGLSDDHTIWSRRTRIETYVANLPLIVVMPDGDRGFYTDHEQGPAYAKHFGEELPGALERYFPARAARSARCIGGLSMGGYGALRIALGYPDRFCSANSHSGAVMVGTWPPRKSDLIPNERRFIFGARPAGSSHDLVALAQKSKAAGNLPRLRIDCGTEDFLLDQNRSYRDALQKLGVAHEYEEFPGAHSWDYWDLHVREAIAFHASAMKLKPFA
jgi:S-formylglutathione hydrolase FrmB